MYTFNLLTLPEKFSSLLKEELLTDEGGAVKIFATAANVNLL
jgi:hypothetical protein